MIQLGRLDMQELDYYVAGVKHLLKERGLKQNEFTSMLGISEQSFSLILNRKRGASDIKRAEIAAGFNMSAFEVSKVGREVILNEDINGEESGEEVSLLTTDQIINTVTTALRQRDEAEEELVNLNKMATLAEDLGGIGYFRRGIKTGQSTWSSSYRKLFGIPDDQESDFNFMINKVVEPQSRAVFTEGFKNALADEDCFKYSATYHAKNLATGERMFCRAVVRIHRNEYSEAISYFGVTQDISNMVDREALKELNLWASEQNKRETKERRRANDQTK